jgi:hypothetical protein
MERFKFRLFFRLGLGQREFLGGDNGDGEKEGKGMKMNFGTIPSILICPK